MARRKKKKKGKGGIIALLLAAIVGAGYFLRDCLPGFGTGGGSGSGTASSDEESESETTEQKTEGEKGTVSIVVKGEECIVDEGDPTPCPQVCDDLKTNGDSASRVDVDATVGAHAVVEELKTCLKEGGFQDVTIRSE